MDVKRGAEAVDEGLRWRHVRGELVCGRGGDDRDQDGDPQGAADLLAGGHEPGGKAGVLLLDAAGGEVDEGDEEAESDADEDKVDQPARDSSGYRR